MLYTSLPNSSLQVSKIAFGTEPLGGVDAGDIDPKDIERAIRAALEVGITTFDTADVYGLGLCEERLAEVLGNKRHDLVLVTKGGLRWEQPSNSLGRADISRDCSPDYIRQAAEMSLRRLRIDAIPIYLIHYPDTAVPIEATLDELFMLQDEGKVKHIGVSNFSVNQIRRAVRAGNIDAVQLEVNLLNLKEIQPTLDFCSENNLFLFGYGILAQGLLSGKYTMGHKFPVTDRRHRLKHFKEVFLNSHTSTLTRLKALSKRLNRTMAQIAIGAIQSSEKIDSIVLGAKSPDQVLENINAESLALSSSEILELIS